MTYHVTDILLRYRQALRQTYNNFIRTLYVDPSFGDSWDNIESALFEAMVFEQLFGELPSGDEPNYARKWREPIRLKLNIGPGGATFLRGIREGNNTTRYQELTVQEQRFDAHFFEFFDWSIAAGMDNQYVQGMVLDSHDEALADGTPILVEVEPARVSFYVNEEPFYLGEIAS